MSRLFCVSAAQVCLLAGSAGALAQTAAEPFLVFEHHGLEAMVVDERDFALRDALAMLPDRVRELPREIDEMPREAAGFIELFLRTVSKPARVAITYDGENPSGGFFGYGFVASIECDGRREANEIRDAILEVTDLIAFEQGLERFPLEDSDNYEHMQQMMLPFGLMSMGPRQADGAWRYELIVGTVNDPDEVFGRSFDVFDADGFEPLMTAHLDMGALTPMARIATNMLGGQAPQVREISARLEEAGIIGENAMSMGQQVGTYNGMSVSCTRIHDARDMAEMLSLPTRPLASSVLHSIPGDVYGVSLGQADFSSIEDMVMELAAYGLPVEDALDQFEEMTGVDVLDDVIGSLGGEFAFYNAESTGGGSLLSAVAMMGIEDQRAFSRAIHRLTDLANDVISDEADLPADYIIFHAWDDDASDAEYITLRFPGLPVPFEVTMAFTDDWFIGALSPQAAVAAARQTLGHGDEGLMSNARFAAMYALYGEGSTGLSFVDTPRTIRSGYPFLSMIGSGISNLVRSPHDPDEREPGLILPLYNDLVNESTLPMVKFTRWEGEDLVSTQYMDQSIWVQGGGAMGAGSAALPLILGGAMAAGVASGEMGGMVMHDWRPDPMVLVEGWRRSFYVDPVAELTAALTAIPTVRDGWDAGLLHGVER